ncbi:MAG: cobalt-precorrin 5A hydrolase [Mogibacterium sp.]|nr:cobalt-precorrin 5A hydrolase [Mogibacterium sp.]MBR0451575.1 cobalt-precorrin 5A hydrolase [Oscillospiraceae bacterium]
MRLRIVSYTEQGRNTAAGIAEAMRAAGHSCRQFALPKFCAAGDEPLKGRAAEWAAEGFREADALIFCCASGIAVRAIAPSVKDKTTDPAVIVVDELGHYVIPLLSGHIGGANELALAIAEELGATPVLTTATDLHGLFAVDVFASKNHLAIGSMALAKAVSAALLAGDPVGFRSDFPYEGTLPQGLTEGEAELGIYISDDQAEDPFPKTLHLVPKRYAAGMGCRRGKPKEELEAFLLEQLEGCGVSARELRCIASIDLKADEPGLLALSGQYRIPLLTYSAEQLSAVPGEFTASAFVKEHTGVDSVCERAAVLASNGPLIVKKTAANGMTFALAKYEEAISFE